MKFSDLKIALYSSKHYSNTLLLIQEVFFIISAVTRGHLLWPLKRKNKFEQIRNSLHEELSAHSPY